MFSYIKHTALITVDFFLIINCVLQNVAICLKLTDFAHSALHLISYYKIIL